MVQLEIEGTITEVDFLNVMKQTWSIPSLYTLVAPSLPRGAASLPPGRRPGVGAEGDRGGSCECSCTGRGPLIRVQELKASAVEVRDFLVAADCLPCTKNLRSCRVPTAANDAWRAVCWA